MFKLCLEDFPVKITYCEHIYPLLYFYGIEPEDQKEVRTDEQV